MPRKKIFSPGRVVLVSVLLTILLGSLVLKLPISQAEPLCFIDCLFTAASSACVTGVLTVPLDAFTYFGKIIILILMQIGGVGLITLSLCLISLFTELGLATKLMAGQVLELETSRHLKQVLIFIAIFTISIELLGALCIYFIISPSFSFGDAIFNSLFHSVSSFCSVGLSFAGNSLIAYKDNIPMLTITGILILLGTTGFMTWYELVNHVKRKLAKKRRRNISLTTKIVVSATIIMILTATVVLLLLESYGAAGTLSWPRTIFNMLFNAISYRSTGFTSISLSTMQPATILFILMYSLIGSSPNSTGSGIKVTTFVIVLATIRSILNERSDTEIKGRRIAQDQVFKSLSILSLSFCWIIISTFLLLIFEPDKSFIDIFFEAVSSFTTLGLATEITPCLSTAGKILIMINMFIGRLGSLTFLLAFIRRKIQERAEFQYPEERVMI